MFLRLSKSQTHASLDIRTVLEGCLKCTFAFCLRGLRFTVTLHWLLPLPHYNILLPSRWLQTHYQLCSQGTRQKFACVGVSLA